MIFRIAASMVVSSSWRVPVSPSACVAGPVTGPIRPCGPRLASENEDSPTAGKESRPERNRGRNAERRAGMRRPLDAIAPELDHITGSVGARAIGVCGLDVSRYRWDLTSISLYGAYPAPMAGSQPPLRPSQGPPPRLEAGPDRSGGHRRCRWRGAGLPPRLRRRRSSGDGRSRTRRPFRAAAQRLRNDPTAYSGSMPKTSARPLRPWSVTWTARLRSARRIQVRSKRRSVSAAPREPARWGRCSLQSMQ
jgi:hypothetical protein